MKHLILKLSLILGLATSVSANNKPFAVGDVFYCQMEEFVSWKWKDAERFKKFKLEKFRFTISDKNTIKFGQGGYLSDMVLNISYLDSDLLSAAEEKGTISLEGANFSYVNAFYAGAKLIAATCDRF